ncbi:hypothetical protein CAOG_08429 [Capsaspora owczarzaki ATCC 30864]|uniref:RAE1/2 domain-containing protein n=1 Tax=Capsaspora owczarzaki (strain ATCC 30864) TaxID=595528 RepID=A0A0D2WHE9_CAPO3|nr:hypothetical protein CAOG_08429 [Capsaspora owczarzaki ATCC 30864]KJE89040.1 hypothetical protein CAOG_008429 [Capsaspora owczarzaki ATCC 30864]|eukprot:XP_011270000.1 hypothetical protein CAOG_08429 [Capsaspora owczarzaki ATCC 30864]
MADSELERPFDVIVLGTGLVESIVAAAAARAGKRVLHLDPNNYYGGAAGGSFTLDELGQVLTPEWPASKTSSSTAAPSASPAAGSSTTDDKPTTALTEAACVQTPAENADSASSILREPASSQPLELERRPLPAAADRFYPIGNAVVEQPLASAADIWAPLARQSRRFTLDVSPRGLFSRSRIVELLISSNVGRYLEFKPVDQMCFARSEPAGEAPQPVPCSRADVFSSSAFGMLDKRVLMKLLSFCVALGPYLQQPTDASQVDPDVLAEFTRFKDTSLVQWLRAERKLSPKLLYIVLYAIAAVDESSTGEPLSSRAALTVEQGVDRLCQYLSSLGRYSRTPMLWSQYGVAELSQAFCRLCAVFAGTYILRADLASMLVSSSASPSTPADTCATESVSSPTFAGFVDTEGHHMLAPWLVASPEHVLPASAVARDHPEAIVTLRAILVTNRSVFPAVGLKDQAAGDASNAATEPGAEESSADSATPAPAPPVNPDARISFVCIPPDTYGNRHLVHMVELGANAGAAPAGAMVVHLTCQAFASQLTNPRAAFGGIVAHYFDHNAPSSVRPVVLWSAYFDVLTNAPAVAAQTDTPANVILCAPMASDSSIQNVAEEARAIFDRIFPGEPFLPAAPNPEDITWDAPSEATSDSTALDSTLDAASDAAPASSSTDPTAAVLASDTIPPPSVAFGEVAASSSDAVSPTSLPEPN